MDFPDDPGLNMVAGRFADRDPGTSTPGSTIPAELWANAVTDELIALEVGAGLTPDKATFTQVRDAVQILARGGAFGFRAKPQGPATLSLDIEAGAFFNRKTGLMVTVSATTAGPIGAPATNPRNDIVYVDVLTGAVGIKTGTEAAGPVDPSIDADKLPIARIKATVAMAEITAADLDELRYLLTMGFSRQGAFEASLLSVRDEKSTGTNGGATTATTHHTRDLNAEKVNEIDGGGLVFNMPYDAQTANYTVGRPWTGGTSGATALIVGDSDAGATGTLKLVRINGTPQDNEIGTDDLGGSATTNIPSGVTPANQIYLPAGTYYFIGSTPAYVVGTFRARLYNASDSSDLILGGSQSTVTGGAGGGASMVTGRATLAAGKLIELRMYAAQANATHGLGIAVSDGLTEVYSTLDAWRIA